MDTKSSKQEHRNTKPKKKQIHTFDVLPVRVGLEMLTFGAAVTGVDVPVYVIAELFTPTQKVEYA